MGDTNTGDERDVDAVDTDTDTDADTTTEDEADTSSDDAENTDAEDADDDDTSDGDDADADDDTDDDGEGNSDTESSDTADDDGDEDEDDDGDEPPTRRPKTNAEWAAKRVADKKAKKQQTKEKSGSDADDAGEDTGDDDEASDDPVAKEVAKQLAPFKQQAAEQEVDGQIASFLENNPDFKPYAAKVRRWALHPSRRNLPVKSIFYEVAGDKLMAIGAKRGKAADVKAKKTRGGRGSTDTTGGGSKSYKDTPLTQEGMGAEIEAAKTAGARR